MAREQVRFRQGCNAGQTMEIASRTEEVNVLGAYIALGDVASVPRQNPTKGVSVSATKVVKIDSHDAVTSRELGICALDPSWRALQLTSDRVVYEEKRKQVGERELRLFGSSESIVWRNAEALALSPDSRTSRMSQASASSGHVLD